MVLEVKKPRPMWEIIFSTHHTDIGLLYIISSITFLMMGGALALAIRAELFLPGQQMAVKLTLICMEKNRMQERNLQAIGKTNNKLMQTELLSLHSMVHMAGIGVIVAISQSPSKSK